MLTKSPSGALSPYYYKGGSFHGIHYGSFADDREGLLRMMAAEEEFALRSPQSRRIMIDLFETDLTPEVLADFAAHIERLRPRIVKLGISAEKKHLILPPDKNPATERSFCAVAASPSSQRSCRLRLLPAPCHDAKILVHLLGFLSGASMKKIRKALLEGSSLGEGQLYLAQDMEETKTWLVA